MRKALLGWLVGGLGLLGARPAAAETLLSFSGQVALADGAVPEDVHILLQADLDRNGELQSFETVSATTEADGRYVVQYDLDPRDVDLELLELVTRIVKDFQERGFDALLDTGPLPVVMSFEREGYGTVVRRLNTSFQSPNLDVVLTPLADVQCSGSDCLSANGAVRFGDFPGGTGIARAFAAAYDPSRQTTRFPGVFADRDNALLVSSGFAEINLYDESGTPLHQLSRSVKTRFAAQRESWATLPDLQPNTGRIELPMYSFDRASGEWVPEANGELTFADGQTVSEDDLAAIHDGSFTRDVFVSFETSHFSTFNCDAPIQQRACVKGRIVDKATGKALPGVSVSVDGVSYTGTAGTLVTGTDGAFAADVRKSELVSEDVDRNGQRGERLQARVTANAGGIYMSEAFETPTRQSSVGPASRPSCKPADCDCLDLGNIAVEFEAPRLCEVTLEPRFSGRHIVGSGGPLAAGDAVVGANVRGELVGNLPLPQAAVAAICEGGTCGPVVAPESGLVTFAVPVAGDAPMIRVEATFKLSDGSDFHYYIGSRVFAGCARGEDQAPEEGAVELDHSAVTGLGDYIASLGTGALFDDNEEGCFCCAVEPASDGRGTLTALLAGAIGAALLRRRQRA